jgi:hypothetical protein
MPPKKLSIMRKPKKKLKEHFQEILQGSFPDIYQTIVTQFKLESLETTIEDSTQIKNIKDLINKQFFDKDELQFLKPINSFQYLYSKECDENQLGKLPFAHNITNCKDCNNLLLFRHHNPVKSNILRAIYFNLNDSEFQKKLNDFETWFSTNKKDKNFSQDMLPFIDITKLDQGILTGVYELLELLSEFDNTNFVLYSQTLNKIIKKKDIGPWYTHNNIITNINNKKIMIIYLRNNDSKGIIFEPVNLIDLTQKSLTYYISDSPFYTYLINLIQKKNIQLVKKTLSQNIEMKLDSITKILFNPYDKDVDLPEIEIDTAAGVKNFLLGHPYGKFRNIYNVSDQNNLEGKVSINISNNTLDVYWCNKS